MRFLETIEADSRRVQSGAKSESSRSLGHQITIGDDPQGYPLRIQFQPAFLDIAYEPAPRLR